MTLNEMQISEYDITNEICEHSYNVYPGFPLACAICAFGDKSISLAQKYLLWRRNVAQKISGHSNLLLRTSMSFSSSLLRNMHVAVFRSYRMLLIN